MQFVKYYNPITAPLGMDIEPLSSTALNLTVLPTAKPAAEYYVTNFKDGKKGTQCIVYVSAPRVAHT